MATCESSHSTCYTIAFVSSIPYTAETSFSPHVPAARRMVSKGDDVATVSDVSVEHTERLPDAAEANSQEHELTFWQGMKLYPKAVFWSLAMSTVIIMEGFDNKLLPTLYALPVFREDFGHMNTHNKYEVSAPWQSGLGNGGSIGQLAGILIGGHLIERYGFRKMMLAGQTAIVGCIFIQFFAKSLPVLLVAQIVFGESALRSV